MLDRSGLLYPCSTVFSPRLTLWCVCVFICQPSCISASKTSTISPQYLQQGGASGKKLCIINEISMGKLGIDVEFAYSSFCWHPSFPEWQKSLSHLFFYVEIQVIWVIVRYTMPSKSSTSQHFFTFSAVGPRDEYNRVLPLQSSAERNYSFLQVYNLCLVTKNSTYPVVITKLPDDFDSRVLEYLAPLFAYMDDTRALIEYWLLWVNTQLQQKWEFLLFAFS